MYPAIKQLWITALRSDEYPQGTGKLQGDGKYCCLGVLTDLACKAGIVSEADGSYDDDENSVGYVSRGPFNQGDLFEYFALPHEVSRWAGLPDNEPECKLPIEIQTKVGSDVSGATHYTLVSLNDRALYTFDQIADVIEAQF